MSRLNAAAALACAMIALASSAADARPQRHQNKGIIVCNERGCSDRAAVPSSSTESGARRHAEAPGDVGVIGSRPRGCPYRYCGCEASLFLFGKIKPELNLAANWIRYFPRTAPAPKMAAARRGHVMVLISHVSGNEWLVHDGNSGGGKTRRHVRSIRGYVVVDPYGGKVASR